jgi:hypothetical protein
MVTDSGVTYQVPEVMLRGVHDSNLRVVAQVNRAFCPDTSSRQTNELWYQGDGARLISIPFELGRCQQALRR